jgi:dihydroorotase-like cyclic amidohydrolase
LHFSQGLRQKSYLIKCNPSIKISVTRTQLINALNEGLFDYLISDHAPHTYEISGLVRLLACLHLTQELTLT